MPDIKIQNIVSFTSEDKNHPASNLLKSDGSHKWKCATPGEKSASVIFQLEKPETIQSIDIGNEGSSFVEVLVGRSSSITSDQDYQVMLVASSFMTPNESRNNTNRNAVRIFGADKLSKTTINEKWDRIKIVCTQQFNKTYSYGLSFVKFHSTPSTVDDTQPKKTLGGFSLRDDVEKSPITAGSLFANRDKVKTDPPPATGAAAIRVASKEAEKSYSTIVKPTPPASQPQPSTKRRHSNEDQPTNSEKKIRKSPEDNATSKRSKDTATVKASPAPKIVKTEVPKIDTPPSNVALNKLMSGVVFVLSGYQNPERSDIRDKGLEMGAVYKGDWGPACTHLICAFSNTPKYNQVAGKGKIVTKAWILDSYKQRRFLPWKKYRLGNAKSPPTSEDESEQPQPSTSATRKVPQKQDSLSESGGDTEDELEKIKNPQKSRTPPTSPKPTKSEINYEKSTDEDEIKPGDISDTDSNDTGLPYLPDFFSDKIFFLYGDFSAAERRALLRYITAYNGKLESYMTAQVHFVLTYSAWDKNFDDALSGNPTLTFVKPKWVYSCSEAGKLLPFQPHVVVP